MSGNDFRIIKQTLFADGKRYIVAGCTSKTVKPEDNFANMSICVESDTGDTYFYDESADAGSKWVKQFSFQPEE